MSQITKRAKSSQAITVLRMLGLVVASLALGGASWHGQRPHPQSGGMLVQAAPLAVQMQNEVTRTLSRANQVSPDSARMLRDWVEVGARRAEADRVAPNGESAALVAQRNLQIVLGAVLAEGLTRDQRVVLSEGAVASVFQRLCPIYPFC